MNIEGMCQICKSAPATVRITQVYNGEKQQWMLCEKCAEEKGGVSSLAGLPEFFEKVMTTILGRKEDEMETEADTVQCPTCQITFTDFEKIGLLGCPDCYTAFREQLTVLLRRIHGSNKHIGSRPRPQRVFGNVPDLEALRRELQTAIEHEDFERAAEYRDLIRNLERERFRTDGDHEQQS